MATLPAHTNWWQLLLAPLLVACASAQSPPVERAEMGLARVDTIGGCLAIRYEGLRIGTRLTLVHVPLRGVRDSAVAMAADVVTTGIHGSAPCPAEFGEQGDRFYRIRLAGRTDITGPYFAVLAPRGSVSLGLNVASVTLGTEQRVLSLRTCNSVEGIHLTAWRGAIADGQRVFHAYYYLGYDMESSCSVAEVGPRPQVADLTVGTIQLPAGWTQKRTGTKDSEMGQITRADSLLTVNYDIGAMAGAHMSDGRKAECIWYKEQVIHGHPVLVGLVKTTAGRELVVTLFDTGSKEPLKYPANFWATVQNDEDVADALLVALSYEAKP